MKVINGELAGMRLIEPDVFGDARGFFTELWNAGRYRAHGIEAGFVQDNLSRSKRGTLRGLHFQHPTPQGKLVTVLEGEVFDVAVDLRRGSPTFGRWEGVRLSSDNRRQLYVPEGFAHGFQTLCDDAEVLYLMGAFFEPSASAGLRFDDPALAIAWPLPVSVISDRDRALPGFSP